MTRPGKRLQLSVCELENGHRKFVDLPINSMVIFHSYVNVDQRVSNNEQQRLGFHRNQMALTKIGFPRRFRLKMRKHTLYPLVI